MKRGISVILAFCFFSALLMGCALNEDTVSTTAATNDNVSRFQTQDLAVFAESTYLLSKTTSAEPTTYYGRHTGSSYDDHIFVTDGEFFYYIVYSHADENGTHRNLVRQSIQDGQKTILHQFSGKELGGLNISNGWLYLTSVKTTNWPDGEATIWKIRTDGTELSEIYKIEVNTLHGAIHDMLIVNDKIYFIQQAKSEDGPTTPLLMCMNFDGSGVEQLFQGRFFHMTAYNRQLFMLLSGDKTFLCYDIDTGIGQTFDIKVYIGGAPHYLQPSSAGRLYLYKSSAIGTTSSFSNFDLDGSDPVMLDTVYDRYIIVGDKILYYDHSDSNIYCQSLDGTGTAAKITDRAVRKWFNYHNGYLFTCDPDNDQEIYIYPVAVSQPSNLPVAPSEQSRFTDVSSNSYYAVPVEWAVEQGITSGTSATTFSPDNTCTTAQILTFLWRAKGSPEPASTTSAFADIQENDYFYKAALWARENGLVTGTAFDGDTPCTRYATVTYLWKLAGQPEPEGNNPFTDVPSEVQPVVWAMEQEITAGTSATTFSPATTCTRGQIVTFLYRAYAE